VSVEEATHHPGGVLPRPKQAAVHFGLVATPIGDKGYPLGRSCGRLDYPGLRQCSQSSHYLTLGCHRAAALRVRTPVTLRPPFHFPSPLKEFPRVPPHSALARDLRCPLELNPAHFFSKPSRLHNHSHVIRRSPGCKPCIHARGASPLPTLVWYDEPKGSGEGGVIRRDSAI